MRRVRMTAMEMSRGFIGRPRRKRTEISILDNALAAVLSPPEDARGESC